MAISIKRLLRFARNDGKEDMQDPLYREIILEHWTNPQNYGVIKHADFEVSDNNPLCGDEIKITGIIKDNKLIKYARTGADRTSIIYDFKTLNIMKAPSWLVEEGTTVEELINFAKEVKAKGKMGIYQFHGIGRSYFKISATTHRQFLEYLKSNETDYWVTTFSDAMDYATSKNKK